MGIATYSYNRSTSGGEIIRELVNASDGQGLHFANGAALLLAYASGGVFGTADFSIEFILDQDADNSSDNEIYTSQIAGSNVLKVTNSISSNVVRISFDSTNYDIAYDMSGDYGTPTHYVLTCDRSALATLYKNGNSVGTINISGSSAVNLGNGNTADGYLGGVSGYGVIGTYYRWRTWKKLLSSAEVTACYENASVPIADQWSNCVTDLDLAFANPERSLAVRSKSGVGNATASVGVFQLNPIEQLNSKSARIGTSAATPADGDLVVSGSVGVGVVPSDNLHVAGNSAVRNTIVSNVTLDGGTSAANPYEGFGFGVNFIGRDYGDAVRNYAGIYTLMEAKTSSSGGGDAGFKTGLSFYTNSGGASGTNPTEKLRIDSAGLCSFTAGINLGNTASATATTLDGYKEGDFTVGVAGDSSGSLSGETGEYTRIGNVVFVRIVIRVDVNFTSEYISGLPYNCECASSASTWSQIGTALTSVSTNAPIVATAQDGSANVRFFNGANTNTLHSPNTTNDYYRIVGSYFTADAF